jgi:hypothetical protein
MRNQIIIFGILLPTILILLKLNWWLYKEVRRD